jgi:mRNA interferase RelE/StbE
MFNINLTKEAAKYYRKCDKKTKRLLNECFQTLKESLSESPNVKRLHGELEGLYRYRMGSLRLICSIDEENSTVIIVAIGSRGDIYKQ